MPNISLIEITEKNAMQFKDARLRALGDSPLAFGSTLERESNLTDAQWLERAREWSENRCRSYLAFSGEQLCGIVGGVLNRENVNSDKAHLVSMWVAPDHRRNGIGQMLVQKIIQWAECVGARQITLMVTSCNTDAIQFYQRLGFVFTGETEPYPNKSDLLELEMMRVLSNG